MKRLSEILGIEFPFIQGGMANIATGEFAAAVSNAGGLGLIGSGGMNAETLREHIHRVQIPDRQALWREYYADEPSGPGDGPDCRPEEIPVVTTGAAIPALM